MPKFAANLTMLFNEVDFLARFDAAVKAGFRGVEYLFPYPFPKEALADSSLGTASRKCCTICRPATGRRANAASPAFLAARQSFAKA